MTAIDPNVRVRLTLRDLLTLPNSPAKARLLTKAIRTHLAAQRARMDLTDWVRLMHVEAEMHRLNAAADHTYARMAADYTDRIRVLRMQQVDTPTADDTQGADAA